MDEKIKMVDNKQQPLLLLVFLEKKKNKQQPPPSPAVLFVCLWALFNAGLIAFVFAVDYMLTLYATPRKQPSSWLLFGPPDKVMIMACVAEDDMESADEVGYMRYWYGYGVLQAAAATLALLLAGHRRMIRRVLAYAALTAAVAGHCVFAGDLGIVLAEDPGDLFRICGYTVVFTFAVGDLIGFLALLLWGGE